MTHSQLKALVKHGESNVAPANKGRGRSVLWKLSQK